jgi:hypothetical protein
MTAPDITEPTTVPVGPPAHATPEAIVVPVAEAVQSPTPEPSRLDNLATPHTTASSPEATEPSRSGSHLYFDGAGNAFESGPTGDVAHIPARRNHLDLPHEHTRVPETRFNPETGQNEMTGNMLYFDGSGNPLS